MMEKAGNLWELASKIVGGGEKDGAFKKGNV